MPKVLTTKEHLAKAKELERLAREERKQAAAIRDAKKQALTRKAEQKEAWELYCWMKNSGWLDEMRKEKAKTAPPTPPIEGVLFHAYSKTYRATAVVKEDRMILQKGSRIAPISPNCTDTIRKSREKYQDKIANGILMENIPFRSASGALGFVAGQVRNGQNLWLTDAGTPLSAFDWRKK